MYSIVILIRRSFLVFGRLEIEKYSNSWTNFPHKVPQLIDWENRRTLKLREQCKTGFTPLNFGQVLPPVILILKKMAELRLSEKRFKKR